MFSLFFLQCEQRNVSSAEISSEMTDLRTLTEGKETDGSAKSVSLRHIDAPPFKGDGKIIPLQEEKESVPIQQKTLQGALGFGQVLHKCNRDDIHKTVSENSMAKDNCLTQKDGIESSNAVTDGMRDNIEERDVVHTDEHPKLPNHLKIKVQKSCQKKIIPYQKGSTNPKKIHTDDSATRELNVLCNINDSGNEKLLLREECKAVFPDQTDHLTENVDCSATHAELRNKDHLKEGGLDEKESCRSTVKVDQGLRGQLLTTMSDCPGKGDYFFVCGTRPQTNEKLLLGDGTNVMCANLFTQGGSSISKTPYTPPEIKLPHSDSANEKHVEVDKSLLDKTSYQKAALPMFDGSSCSFNESYSGVSSSHSNDCVQTRDKVSDFSFDQSSNRHEDQERKSIQEEENADKINPEEPFQHQSNSPETNDEFGKSRAETVIPFIGTDTIEMSIAQPQVKVEEAVGDQEAIPFISETANSEAVLPSEVHSPFQIYGKTVEHSSHKILLDVIESHEPVIVDSMFGSRCPTPTVDEKIDEYMRCSSPGSSTSAFRDSQEESKINCKFPSRSSTILSDELPPEQKLQTSAMKTDPNLHDIQLDLELRTLKVVAKLDKILSMSNSKDSFSNREAVDMQTSVDQNSNPNRKLISTCFVSNNVSIDCKKEKTSDEAPVRSRSNSKGLPTRSDDIRTIPFTNKIEEILGVKLQIKNTKSSVPQPYLENDEKHAKSIGPDYNSYIPFISAENVQDVHQATSQSSLNHESRSYNQRPVMAVKPSKSEECQENSFSKDVEFETTSLTKQTNAPLEKYTTQTSVCLKKETKEIFNGKSDELNDDNHDVREFSSKTSWSSEKSNISYRNSYPDEEQFALPNPPHHCQRRNSSKFIMIPFLSQSVQSCEPAESYPEVVDDKHILVARSFKETMQQTIEDINLKEYSDKSLVNHKHDGTSEESYTLEPQTSLVCTVLNTGQKETSFLEKVSKRCLQDDLTEASMEQECLIFSERMKNLLKNKKELKCQQDAHDSFKLSCPSPLTVNFSSLEEEEDSLDFLNTSHLGQKMQIDLSDRKDLRDTTEEKKTLHFQRVSNPMEHAGISDMSAECARLYKAKMDDICSVKKVPSRMHQGYPRMEPSKHFDFCDQMKKELDETFRNNLNAVVKKSCTTKYRFYLLVTSDDIFFVETKVGLVLKKSFVVTVMLKWK